jgi:signal transduction histidine kinase
MSKTIDDFRNFFAPNKAKGKFLFKDSMQSVLALMIPQLNNHNIEIKVDGDQNVEVYGFENELKQVLINIVSNAKDAIVSNKDIEEGLIKIGVEFGKTNIYISIQDNAGGVPENLIDKIFEPYFTTKFKSQGTGLGLYMSKVIVEKNMKGELHFHNDDDGAVFCIKLPLFLDEIEKGV